MKAFQTSLMLFCLAAVFSWALQTLLKNAVVFPAVTPAGPWRFRARSQSRGPGPPIASPLGAAGRERRERRPGPLGAAGPLEPPRPGAWDGKLRLTAVCAGLSGLSSHEFAIRGGADRSRYRRKRRQRQSCKCLAFPTALWGRSAAAAKWLSSSTSARAPLVEMSPFKAER